MLTSDRGSVLMLMPAAVLIVLVLAALTVDLGLVHLGRREALAAAQAAASDAVTAGVSEEAYRSGHGYALDARRVEQAVTTSLHARGVHPHLAVAPTIEIEGTTVSVRLVLRVEYLFSPALPGAKHHALVVATGSAVPLAR